MIATEYRSICGELIINHHKQLLQAAIERNDNQAVEYESRLLKAFETAILIQSQTNIERN